MIGKRWQHRLATAVVALVGTMLTAGCALVAEEYERHPSPDGERTLIIRRYTDWVDPMYPLQLQHGPFTADLGCVNGDYSGINSVNWVSNTTLQLNLSDGGDGDLPVVIRFDNDKTTTDDPNGLLHSC